MGRREAGSLRRVYEETRNCIPGGIVVAYAFEFVEGVYKNRRCNPLKGGFRAARMNSPVLFANSFAITGTFFTLEYTLESVRKKDDVFNQIIAGVASVGLNSINLGFLPAAALASVLGPITGLALARCNSHNIN